MTLPEQFQPFLQEAWDKAGFSSLAAIQQKTMPVIAEGKDLIAESPTGSGKTLAYLLPLLNAIQTENKNAQVVVLAPTRELVMQVHREIQTFTTNSDIQSAAFIGGANMKRQIDKLKKHPQIIVGTPGRMQELIKMKKLKVHEVKTIVVDEADQMLKSGLFKDIENIVNATLKDRQLIFFSATMPTKVEKLAKKIMAEPEVIRLGGSGSLPSQVNHIYIVSKRRDKPEHLRKIVRMKDVKALVFINNGSFMNVLTNILEKKGMTFGVLDNEANKTERATTLQQFRAGTFPLLLVTNLAARGLDIEGLTHVVHYDLPEKPGDYVHRSGRTGRMGGGGTVISLVSPEEEPYLHKFSKRLKIPIEQKALYKGNIVDIKRPYR